MRRHLPHDTVRHLLSSIDPAALSARAINAHTQSRPELDNALCPSPPRRSRRTINA